MTRQIDHALDRFARMHAAADAPALPRGMTLKQAAKAEFWDALNAYRDALKAKSGIVEASLRIHRAKGGVPKSWWHHVTVVANGG